jgi:hypothetical protein
VNPPNARPGAKFKNFVGGDMKKAAAIFVAIMLQAAPVMAQEDKELIDEKTGEYTPRGVVASLIASAQVVEMRCGHKNQITAALAKAKRLGVPFDLNDKQDYSAVVFLATQILTRLGKDGVEPWCKDKAPNVVNEAGGDNRTSHHNSQPSCRLAPRVVDKQEPRKIRGYLSSNAACCNSRTVRHRLPVQVVA